MERRRRSGNPSSIRAERTSGAENTGRAVHGWTLPLMYVMIFAAGTVLFLLIWGKETQNLIQALIKLVVKG